MASSRQGAMPQQAAAPDQELDPKYEWQENAANFVLRLHLSGFRKEDFRVQVDGAGRLTVRGQRADGAKHSRFHKVFQLPTISNLDDITGRFDAGVLTLTVPKRPPAPPASTANIEEISKKPAAKQEVDDAKPKAPVDEAKPKGEAKSRPPEDQGKPKDDEEKKPKEDAFRSKATEQVVKEEVDAKRSKPQQPQQKAAPPAPALTKEEARKPEAEAAPPPSAPPTEKKLQSDGERATKAVVDRESLAERVKQRAEEERTAAEEAERDRKQTERCGWKERVAEELQGLTGSEWAEGLVDTVKKNKEVIAAAVAAFSLGLFVSSRLFSRNN